MSGPGYHGWTHAPKAQGGSDPIPGLSDVRPFHLVYLTAGEDISSGTNDELIAWDGSSISDTDYFSFPSSTVVKVLRDGVYEVTGHLVWDSSKVEGSVVTLNSNSTPGFTWNKGWYDEQNAGHTIEHAQTFTYSRRMLANTELRLYVVHFAAVTRTLQGNVGATDTNMEVRYMGSWDLDFDPAD